MNQHLCLFSMGSNTDASIHLSIAQKAVCIAFPDTQFGEKMKTIPIRISNPALFDNQLGWFITQQSVEEIITIFKAIERQCGRKPEDKYLGIVKLDLDLLIYDTNILKPNDMERAYVKEGLESSSVPIALKKIGLKLHT